MCLFRPKKSNDQLYHLAWPFVCIFETLNRPTEAGYCITISMMEVYIQDTNDIVTNIRGSTFMYSYEGFADTWPIGIVCVERMQEKYLLSELAFFLPRLCLLYATVKLNIPIPRDTMETIVGTKVVAAIPCMVCSALCHVCFETFDSQNTRNEHMLRMKIEQNG